MPNGDDSAQGPMTDTDEGGAAAPVMEMMGEGDEEDFPRPTSRKKRKSPRAKFRATRKARRTKR